MKTNPNTTKLSVLLGMMERGEREAAIKFAAKFPQLGTEKVAITRAAAAINQPDFYRQLGRDVTALVAEGWEALERRYLKKQPATAVATAC